MSKLSQGMTNGDSSFKLHDRRCLCTFLFQRNEAGKGCVIPPAALKLIVPQSHLRNTPGPAGPFSVLSAFWCEGSLPLEQRPASCFPWPKGLLPFTLSPSPSCDCAEILLYHGPFRKYGCSPKTGSCLNSTSCCISPESPPHSLLVDDTVRIDI